jgi:hypothetical protein
MIHEPEYMKGMLKKFVEERLSPSELEILLVALDLYAE